MANFTASTAVRNSYAAVTEYAANAIMSVDFKKADDKILIKIRNTNDTAGMTATSVVAAGDYLQNVLGVLTCTMAYNTNAIIGPLDSMRFKDSAGVVNITNSIAGSGTLSNVKIAVIELP
jgi:hypothetical protein